MTILFYATDTIGIGHLSRALAVAQAIRDLAPSLPLVLVTESSDGRLLDEYAFPYYQVPPYQMLFSEDRWRLKESRAALDAWEGIVDAIQTAYSPTLVVYDTFIRRRFHHLVRAQTARAALILRQRSDLPRYLNDHRELLANFSLIAFPHHRAEVGPLDCPWYPEERLVFCGPLLRRTRSDLRVDEVRATYGLQPDEFTIVISNGGGNRSAMLADDFVPVVLSALRTAESGLPPFRAILVTGPLSREGVPWVDFERGWLVVRDFEPRLFDLFAAAHLVIGRGGYNTVLELKQLGVPALCVPAKRQGEDQEGRIRKAGGNIQLVGLERDRLAEAIQEVSRQPWWHYCPPDAPDEIAANKLALARRLIALACGP